MSSQPPFDPSLFADIRKRLGEELLAEMNLRILKVAQAHEDKKPDESNQDNDTNNSDNTGSHKGELLLDASVSPQDIAYPTDLNLLNEAREITEKIIDTLHVPGDKKPRTYRQKAHKEYLKVVDGYAFLDTISWDAFNEGSYLNVSVRQPSYFKVNLIPLTLLYEKT